MILSVRDPHGWYASLAATTLPFVAAKGRHSPPHRNAMADLAERLLARELGDPFDPGRAKAAFEARNARVQEESRPSGCWCTRWGPAGRPRAAFSIGRCPMRLIPRATPPPGSRLGSRAT